MPDKDATVQKLTKLDRKNIDAQNNTRLLLNLSPLKITERNCLKCGKRFETSGHKACNHCRAQNNQLASSTDIRFLD
jgi:uncharacterized OB-fold protein